MNSSLWSLRANSASSVRVELNLLPVALLSLRIAWETCVAVTKLVVRGIALVLLTLIPWLSAPGLVLWTFMLWKFSEAVILLASISSGNRSWIVFQRTVLTVQDLPLLYADREIELFRKILERDYSIMLLPDQLPALWTALSAFSSCTFQTFLAEAIKSNAMQY